MNDYFIRTREDPLGQDKLDDVFNGKYERRHWGMSLREMHAWVNQAEQRHLNHRMRSMFEELMRDDGSDIRPIAPTPAPTRSA